MVAIRRFEPRDAARVSAVIRETMAVSNSGDYPPERLRPLIDYFSPEKVALLAAERDCLVAEEDGRLVGTIGLDGAELVTFFVLPAYQGRGIGARLLAAIEELARARGVARVTVDSSITGERFYASRGYARTGASFEGTAGPQIGMEKHLT
jgi:GNAT superfamily N-acetyltransferase